MTNISRKEERYLQDRGAITFPFVGTLSSVVEKLKRVNEEDNRDFLDGFSYMGELDDIEIDYDTSSSNWSISSTSSSGNVKYVQGFSTTSSASHSIEFKTGDDNDNS